MSKLYFFHAVMNAGKSSHLLQARHTYVMDGHSVLVITSATDNRSGVGVVSSRIGLQADAIAISSADNVFDLVAEQHAKTPLSAVLMDEVNFMTVDHIVEAARVADDLDIPVMAYGLKNNVFGDLFSPAIAKILALADAINEIKQICAVCGRKATMILRYGPDGEVERSGEVIEVGGDNRYVSVCRKHWFAGDIGQRRRDELAGVARSVMVEHAEALQG